MQIEPSSNVSIQYHHIGWADEFPIKILKRKPGSININKLHYHSGLEIGICYEGSGLFILYNQMTTFQKDDLIIVPADQPHVVVSCKEDPSYWDFLLVDTERLFYNMGVTDYEPINNILRGEELIPYLIKSDSQEELREIVKQIVFEVKSKLPEYQLTTKTLLWTFLLKLTRLKYLSEGDKNTYQAYNYTLISPAVNYISNNYAEDISIDGLSELCFLSRTHFERVFKKVMNYTPLEYIKRVRIRISTNLLKNTDLSILDIASDVGYHSVSSFNRQFLQLKKCTPRDYRKRYR